MPRTLRELVWMVEGRQRSDWMQTLALQASIHNLFASKNEAIDPRELMPPHLLTAAPVEDESPAEIAANWDFVRSLVESGALGSGGAG